VLDKHRPALSKLWEAEADSNHGAALLLIHQFTLHLMPEISAGSYRLPLIDKTLRVSDFLRLLRVTL